MAAQPATSKPQKISAAHFMPPRLNLTALRRAAAHCEGCELYKNATQTVFGEGPRHSKLMLLGEVPGDEEDKQGHPFVGPAGRLLGESLDQVGISRDEVYVTNAVKHFRWEPRGKRRLHKKPGARHIAACRPWLQAEILITQPQVIVCLGTTAAQAMLGRDFRLTKQRGKFLQHEEATWIVATYHPSAILRTPDRTARQRLRREFVRDLSAAMKRLRSAPPK